MSIETNIRKLAKLATEADAEVAQAVAPLRGTAAVKALALFGDLGDQPPLRLLSSALLAFGLATANRRLAAAGARMLIAHEVATMVKGHIKDSLDRTRPRSARSDKAPKIKRGRSKAKEKSSFPSGHSAGATAVARAFAREYPEHQLAALGAAGLISGAQVPRSAHYVTDVLAGVSIGVAAEAASNLIWPLPAGQRARKRSKSRSGNGRK